MNSITLKPELKKINNLKKFILNEIGKEDFQVDFIVEEIFVNIVNYSKTEFVTINVEYDNPTLTMEFIDNGIEFNPLLAESPTMPSDIDEAQVGGLGIYLTKKIADELDYSYINGENHLKIIKNVK